jgi:hypothetical protein
MLMEVLVKSSRSSRIAFSAAIIIIVAIAAYNWMVAPHANYLHAAQQYELMASDVARKNQLIKAKEAAKKKQLESFQAKLEGAQTAMFREAEGRKFFAGIEALCNKTRCIVSSINFVPGNLGRFATSAQSNGAIVEKSAVVCFVGSYNSIISFIEKLTNRPQKILIRSLKIIAFSGRSSPLECEMMITIFTVGDEEVSTNE